MDNQRRGRAAVVYLALIVGAAFAPAGIADPTSDLRFEFARGDVAGAEPVAPDAAFAAGKSFGWIDEGAAIVATQGGVTADKPFAFTAVVPEGNYDVTVTLGGAAAAADFDATVKAEARRLVLEHVHTAPGQTVTRTFTVNVRRPDLKDGGHVKLKPDERGHRDWDDQLTIEFLGSHPVVGSLVIKRNDAAVTLFVAGDSTVCDQGKEPYCGWAQMLPRFFKPGVAVANEAESGESLRSSLGARRLDKILETMKPGDYLFIQFGHNDQKDKSAGAGAFTTYTDLLKQYVAAAKQRGGVPVLVTSMNRRTFGPDGKIVNSLGDFPEAVRQVAREEDVALIDLHAMSERFYEAMGPERSTRAFVQYPAGTFPGQPKELKDNTHFNAYGAYELARCVVEGIKADGLPVAKYIAEDVGAFDPSRPDAIEAVAIPPSPYASLTVPEGK